MKIYSLILISIFQCQGSAWASAPSALNCQIIERFNEEVLMQDVTIPIQAEDPHGSLDFVSLKKDPEQLVMMAYLKEQVVISVSDQTTGAASSSSAVLKSPTDLAHHQVLFASKADESYSVIIDCRLGK